MLQFTLLTCEYSNVISTKKNRLVVTIKDEFTKQLPDVKYGDSFAYLCINSHIIEGVKRK